MDSKTQGNLPTNYIEHTSLNGNGIPINISKPFPLSTFLSPSSRSAFAGDEFPDNKFSSSLIELLCESKKTKCCSCEEGCMRTRSCCIDKFWTEWNVFDLVMYIDLFMTEARQYPILACEPIVAGQTDVDYILMVTTCVEGTSEEDKKRCMNRSSSASKLSLPVLSENNTIYRNAYCARCNNVVKFKPISVTADCYFSSHPHLPTNEKEHVQFLLNNCSNIRLPSSLLGKKMIQKCNPNITRCENKDSPFYEVCHAYKGQVDVFANIHCLLCSEPTTDLDSLYSLLFGECPGKDIGFHRDTGKKFTRASWWMLISFSRWDVVDIKLCESGEFYNRDQNCIRFQCVAGYEVVESRCEEIMANGENIINVDKHEFDACLWTPHPTLFVFAEREKLGCLGIWLDLGFSTNITDVLPYYCNSSTTVLYKSLSTDTNETTLESRNYDVAPKLLERSYEMILVPFDPHDDMEVSELYGFDLSRSFMKRRLCGEVEKVDPGTVNFTSQCDVIVNGTLVPRWQVSIWKQMTRGQRGETRNMTICRRFHLHSGCRLQNLSRSYTKIDSSNNLHYYNPTTNESKIYPIEDYIPGRNGFQVCMEDEEVVTSQAWMQLMERTSYYISVVGSCFSVCSYLVIIFSISLFKPLRTIPGLCILALSLCLLIVDTLFLVWDTMSWYAEVLPAVSCKVIGIAMHYCLILAHAWSMLIALDVSCKFRSKGRTFWQSMQITQFYRNIAVSFCVASLLEVTLLVLDHTSILYVGFGNQGFCFIHGFKARLLFYVTPAVSSAVFTFLAFLYVICNISESRRKSSIALGRSMKNHNNNIFFIALKLALIFGVTEVVSFIQVPNPSTPCWKMFNSIMNVIYSILRSLRGVLLAAVHVCRMEVFHLYRDSISSASFTG